ncbi:MAG: GTPase Era [Clostridia bacterium]
MFKSGFIAIIGKANVGKSTLINFLVGEKVASISARPQTTRNKILGILNGEGYQAVFVDTPGLHKPINSLSNYMMKAVDSALDTVDVVIYLIDVQKRIDEHDFEMINKFIASKTPLIVALNKGDSVPESMILAKYEQINAIEGIKAIIPISALNGKNVELLKTTAVDLLKEGEVFYPEEIYTDKNLRFMASETIREKALRYLNEEVPHGICVLIDKFEETEKIVNIDATIICEKTAHKPIIIGKNGDMLKKIATASRLELENLIGNKVFLTLWVKVQPDWRDNEFLLQEFGYNKKKIE